MFYQIMLDWNLQYVPIIKKLIAISKLNQSILNFIDKITNIAACLWLFIITIIINFYRGINSLLRNSEKLEQLEIFWNNWNKIVMTSGHTRNLLALKIEGPL